MEIRFVIAYALIALIAAAAAIAIWRQSTSDDRRRRRRDVADDARWEASRQAAVKASESAREGR